MGEMDGGGYSLKVYIKGSVEVGVGLYITNKSNIELAVDMMLC
jgi:hypothetical protein